MATRRGNIHYYELPTVYPEGQKTITQDHTIVPSDRLIFVNNSNEAPVVITLPEEMDCMELIVINVLGASQIVYPVIGSLSLRGTDYSAKLICDGSGWQLQSIHAPRRFE